MRTLILSVLFALAVIGAGVAVFAHEIPDFSHKHEDGEAGHVSARGVGSGRLTRSDCVRHPYPDRSCLLAMDVVS